MGWLQALVQKPPPAPLRRPEEPLVKILSLSRKDISFRLAMESVSHNKDKLDIDGFYSGLLSVKSKRDRYFIFYSLSLLLLLLVHLGGVSRVEFFGIGLQPGILEQSSLMMMSAIMLMYGYHQGKMVRYDHFFHGLFDRSSQAESQRLLLKYPEAFNVLQFGYYIVGRPEYTFPHRAIPFRVFLLIIILLPCLVSFAVFNFWLVGSVAFRIWFIDTGLPIFWSRALVSLSLIAVVFTYLMPTMDGGRREHRHYGITTLLTRIQQKDPMRHRRYLDLIGKILARMEKM